MWGGMRRREGREATCAICTGGATPSQVSQLLCQRLVVAVLNNTGGRRSDMCIKSGDPGFNRFIEEGNVDELLQAARIRLMFRNSGP